MSLKQRLAKLEAAMSTKHLSDEELVSAIESRLARARMTVAWHINHPEGMTGQKISSCNADDVTLEQILACVHVSDTDRRVAELLIEAGYRKAAAEFADLV